MSNPRHRSMFIALVAVLALSAGVCFNQQPASASPESLKLAQNIQDMETRYTVANAYRGMGYLDASIQLRHVDGKDVLEVAPGERYHFGKIELLGVPPELAEQMLKDPGAPRPEQVYSGITVKLWVTLASEKYASGRGGLKLICQSGTNDRIHHVVNIVVRFQSADLPMPASAGVQPRDEDFCRTGF